MGTIDGLLFQQDQNLVAWESGTAFLMEPENASLIRTTSIQTGTIFAASPLDNWLAVSIGLQMQLRNSHSGGLSQTLEGEAIDLGYVDYRIQGQIFRQFNSAAFSPDGSLLAAAGSGGIRLYDGKTGTALDFIEMTYPYKIVISPDNRYLMGFESLGINGVLPLIQYDIAHKDYLNLSIPLGDPVDFAFSPDGQEYGILIKSWNGPNRLIISAISSGFT
jgi:WD40 repeat protein